MTLTPISQDAVNLLLQGSLCLSEIETNGIQIDVPYLEKTIERVHSEIAALEERMLSTPEWRLWKSMYKSKAKITSRYQLGVVLFDNIKNVKTGNLGYTCTFYTEKGAPEVSERSLQDIDLPFAKDYVEYMSLQKVLSTNLKGIADEVDSNGILHPSFNLQFVKTYRSSCVAKGTPILIARDVTKGGIQYVPIEKVCDSDYVCCFSDDMQLKIRKVLWAGKTGHHNVVRLRFGHSDKESRYIDLTPEHKIRMANGEYVQAIDILKTNRSILSVHHDNPYSEKGDPKAISIEWLNDSVDVYDIHVKEFHNFITNTICVHNSDSPNFQNFPVRNKKLSKIVRQCFIARQDNHFVELDYAGSEVRCNANINGDPALRKYIIDPSSDMHKDMAVQIFKLSPEQVTKPIRNIAKGGFVFASFYGSWWVGLAEGLWDQVRVQNPKTANDIPLMDHLKSVGLKKLGTLNSGNIPEPGSFYEHIKDIATDFWENRFPVYNQWKKDTWNSYLKTGYVETPMGFRCSGVFTRNEILDIPAQSSSFHCLLWSLIQLQTILKKNNCKTLLIGQIHDSIVADVPDDELDKFLRTAEHVMTDKLKERWKWLTIPMAVEAEVADVGKTWFDKKPYPIPKN